MDSGLHRQGHSILRVVRAHLSSARMVTTSTTYYNIPSASTPKNRRWVGRDGGRGAAFLVLDGKSATPKAGTHAMLEALVGFGAWFRGHVESRASYTLIVVVVTSRFH